MSDAVGVRGVALVERVIAALHGGPGDRFRPTLRGPATPLPEPELAELRFAGGQRLPASLRRWLAYDARFLHLFADPARPRFAPLGFRALLAQEFGGFAADAGWEAFDERLPGDCYLLPGGSDARRFLYVGEADSLGEYPVLCVDTHDVPFVCVYSPGFDVWLAETFRVLPGYSRQTYTDLFDHPAYAASMAEQARRNFGGFRALDESGADTAHLDGDAWSEATGVGTRASAAAQLAGLDLAVDVADPDDLDVSDDEETRPGANPFTGRPQRRRHGF
jgi:hypothetical protein